MKPWIVGCFAMSVLTGCATVSPIGSAATTPSSSVTPTTVTTPIGTAASPVRSATNPSTTRPGGTATPTASGSATASGPAVAALSCTPSVSGETGDPIIVISYQVTAASQQRWTLTLRYTNDWGRTTESRHGRGDKSETFKAYGSVDPESKPDCRATIRPR